MGQPEFLVPLNGSHEPTDLWAYAYESPEGDAHFSAAIVCLGQGEYAAYIHIYADNDQWNISGGTGGGGIDEVQRLWFDSYQVAEVHIHETFKRAIEGRRQ
jgi:hypothetical protein